MGKASMSRNLFTKARVAVAIVVTAGSIFTASITPLASVTAFAAEPTLSPSLGLATRAERLEWLYKREQQILQFQQNRLAKIAKVEGLVQKVIDALKANGLDTTALQAALTDFQSAASAAQGYFNTAQSTLSTHSGFDANGVVTVPEDARTTLRTAGRAELQYHQTLRKAMLELRKAIRQSRQTLKTHAANPVLGGA